jgi:quercetin dioxygenase-like cupin family protein
VIRIVHTGDEPTLEKLPGWRGKMIHADAMTFAHWEFDEGAEIHEHHHEQEEVWHVLSGRLEVTADGETAEARAGDVVILSPETRHRVRVLAAGRAIVADHPSRRDFGAGGT